VQEYVTNRHQWIIYLFIGYFLYIFYHRRSWHGPPPFFSNFLFTNLFSIKFLYFFIILSLFPYFNLFVSIFIQSYANIKLHVSTLIARGTDHPPFFSNFLFTDLFSIKFLYFFIISSLFPDFNLFVSIFIQSYVNIKLEKKRGEGVRATSACVFYI
jgi:hypothetical protein